MNKKGQNLMDGSMLDVIIWVIMAFVITMLLGIWFYGTGVMTDALIAIDAPVGNGSTNVSNIAIDTFGNVQTGLGLLKVIAFVLIFSMIITSVIMSVFVTRMHPVMFFAYFAFIMLAVVLSVPISNEYEVLIQNNVFGQTLQDFKGSTFILLNLPAITVVVGFLGLIFSMVGIIRDRQSGGLI